jgi:hypothetical protein
MGLSRRVTVHCGTSLTNDRHTKSSRHPAKPKIRKVKLNKTRQELEQAQRKQNERIASMCPHSLLVLYAQRPPCAVLSFQERQDILNLTENDVSMGFGEGDDGWEDDNSPDVLLAVPPPGEEGFFISHAGGESTLQQIFVDSLSNRYVSLCLSTSETN